MASWWAPSNARLWMDAHEFAKSINLTRLDLNFSLTSLAGLKIVDRYGLTPNRQKPAVRLAQPVVKRRHGDAQTLGRLVGAQVR